MPDMDFEEYLTHNKADVTLLLGRPELAFPNEYLRKVFNHVATCVIILKATDVQPSPLEQFAVNVLQAHVQYVTGGKQDHV